jgi:hypothetical protein
MTGRRAKLIVLILVLVLGAAAGGAAHAQDASLEPTRDRIAYETAAIRELPPLAHIDDVLLTHDELLARMPELIAEESDPDVLAAQSRTLAALGLIPEGTDLFDLTVRLMSEQAAGFYDPISDQMFVVADGPFDAEEYFYSHEVVHALQDAHLDPNDLMEETESDNSDATLARSALYEGDAVTASNAYLAKHRAVAVALLRKAQSDFPELETAPGAMSAVLVFPYVAGESFVGRLQRAGGWNEVDAAYAEMPASTEQILHPDKYLQRDRPSSVALPDPTEALGDGWGVVDADTLGEFQTSVLLANFAPGQGFDRVTGGIELPEAARNAAAGWDGDRFALWENASSGQDVLVWRSVWDTNEDARAFSHALVQFENTRWGGTFTGERADDVTLTTSDVAARLVLKGQEVLYVQAPDLALANDALAALQTAPAPDPAPGPG